MNDPEKLRLFWTRSRTKNPRLQRFDLRELAANPWSAHERERPPHEHGLPARAFSEKRATHKTVFEQGGAEESSILHFPFAITGLLASADGEAAD
jgi:hypothetical protein